MNHFVVLVFANLSPGSVTFCTIFFLGWPISPGKKQNQGKSPGPSPSFRHVQIRKQPQQHKNTRKTLWRNLFFPLWSTATFLNSLEKRQKCSQQINSAD